MSTGSPNGEFPEYGQENRRLWEVNALWWDDRIGDGNDFQRVLIEPATERLLGLAAGDVVLDVACGAGRFARRMARLGATVVACDYSGKFIERARQRGRSESIEVEYHVLDAGDEQALLALGRGRFDRAVCTMGLMDMPCIDPLMRALAALLKPAGRFVFSVTHPCFHSAGIERFAEMHEQEAGRHVFRSGVKVWAYLTPAARKTEGIIGQPEPQYYFHRPLQTLFEAGFRAGFVIDALAEPGFPAGAGGQGLRWDDMPDIPPVLAARLRLAGRPRPQ